MPDFLAAGAAARDAAAFVAAAFLELVLLLALLPSNIFHGAMPNALLPRTCDTCDTPVKAETADADHDETTRKRTRRRRRSPRLGAERRRGGEAAEEEQVDEARRLWPVGAAMAAAAKSERPVGCVGRVAKVRPMV